MEGINLVLAMLKWPVAALMVVLFFPALYANIMLIDNSMTIHLLIWFYVPMFVVWLIWIVFWGLHRSFFVIFEHEVTHLIFALLTFHMPYKIDFEQDRGGYFVFKGDGNWLIAIAPYFFPTVSLLVVLVGFVLSRFDWMTSDIYLGLLGIGLGYNLISTVFETHHAQSDLKRVGYLFSFLFLPTANLLVFGFLLAFAVHGWAGFPFYWSAVVDSMQYYRQIFI